MTPERSMIDDCPTKHCGKCERTLPIDAFYKRAAATIGGRQAWCRTCMADEMRRHRANKAAAVAAIPLADVLSAMSGENIDFTF